MATFEQYKKKDGKKAWMFKAYLGIDQVTGKEIRTTRRGFSSKRLAQDELNQLMVDFKKNNNVIKDNNMTYFEAYELWLDTYKKTVKEGTLNKVKSIFNRTIHKKFYNQKLSELTPKYCQSVVNEWHNQYVSYDQITFYASSVVKHAFNLELIDSNPFDKITIPKSKSKTEPFTNFLSKEQLKELLDVTQNDKLIHVHIRILAFSGIRNGEALALNWNDVDFTKKTINVNKTLSLGENNKIIFQTPKSPKSIRKIPMDDETMDILKKWKYQQEAIFSSYGIKVKPDHKQFILANIDNKNQSPTQFNHYLKKYSKEINLHHITPHGLRHTHASLLFEAGVSMKEIQERLGHSNANFTSDIYTHLTEAKKEETAQKLSDYLLF